MRELNREHEIFKQFKEIKDHPKYGVNPLGEIKNLKTGRILKPDNSHRGYKRIEIDGNKYYIHRLVAENFVPNDNPEKWNKVIHKNGDLSDNFFNNLKWVK